TRKRKNSVSEEASERKNVQLRWRLQALGFPVGSSLCLSLPPPLNGRSSCLDCWIVADMHMPMLLVPDPNSGACVRIDEGSTACHGVVHLSDPLLMTCSFYLPSIC
ncbi:hypothetical protein CR513_00255, partial [Mucuna pruriens]